ncbi:MAG: hypothetical protein WC650_01810 [Candidatus Doudnabacteria bacterium]
MADFTLDFQRKKTSYVFDVQKGKIIELEGRDKVAAWIDALAEKPDVQVYTELGGATSGPILALEKVGAKIQYVTPTQIKKARESGQFEKKIEDAELIWEMHYDPEWSKFFRTHLAVEQQILNLSTTYSVYTGLISARVALQNSITSTYGDAAWLNRTSGQNISEYIEERCANNPAFAATLDEEEHYRELLEKAVEEIEFYCLALKPIPGVAARIGAGAISVIRFASRFCDGAPMKIAKKRFGEYISVDGEGIDNNLRARRRTKNQGDIGLPEAKALAHFIAEQAVRQSGTSLNFAYLWRKLKDYHTILDELLNSPERVEISFPTPKKGNGKGEKLSPKIVAHRRAMRIIKGVFFVDYLLPNMYAWEKGELKANFDAENELAKICAYQIGKDKTLIEKHQALRLARLPYKQDSNKGPVAYGDWITVCELDKVDSSLDILAAKIMAQDLKEELQNIQNKLENKAKRTENETDEHLQASLARRQEMIGWLQDTISGEITSLEDLNLKLSQYGRSLVFETRGIGEEINSLIKEQTLRCHAELTKIEQKQNAAEAPLVSQVESFKKEIKEAQRESSALRLRGARKSREEEIRSDGLPQAIDSLNQKFEQVQEELKELRKSFDKERRDAFKPIEPLLDKILGDDKRLQNRSSRDLGLIRQTILAMIELQAEKGLL